MSNDFGRRSLELERIDTGDYTPEEYATFLREIRVINRLIGDVRALRHSLLGEITASDAKEFSVLDVGAGAGELLRETAKFARRTNRKCRLYGLELNAPSAKTILDESREFPEIAAVRGDAFALPFADGAVDFAMCSLFTHHFTDDNVVAILREMRRVARRGVFVIDLHRHRSAYLLYRLFCFGFRISTLVREDGSLSILRGFVPAELASLASRGGFKDFEVTRVAPFRLVLRLR